MGVSYCTISRNFLFFHGNCWPTGQMVDFDGDVATPKNKVIQAQKSLAEFRGSYCIIIGNILVFLLEISILLL